MSSDVVMSRADKGTGRHAAFVAPELLQTWELRKVGFM